LLNLEIDTPIYVTTHKQYGVIRKLIKQASHEEGKKDETQIQYEVRLSNSLENVVVDPSTLKRLIALNIRLHSYKGGESHNISV
jgi:hypothetical protein